MERRVYTRRPPPLFAIVEVWGGSSSAVQEAMLAHACRLSRSGRVVAVLNGIAADDCLQLLRNVAADEGVSPERVELATIRDAASLLADVTRAPIVAAASAGFRTLVDESGISVRHVGAVASG